ncbi:Glutaredoxin [Candidatus Norongarragalina meridionalis]|nr:Glutaredoxin [Candidatus Norongarragalina meridionalis]
MEFKRVPGKKVADVVLYAISTCPWCGKTKALLKELGVEYRYVDCDLLEGKDADEADEEVVKYNPRHSFPTMVINGKKVITGFNEDAIREALG